MKTLLFFLPLVAFVVWQYLSVSRALDEERTASPEDDEPTDAGS
jgi:hypothetical protein